MAQPFIQRVRRRLAGFMDLVFGMEIASAPANLAEEVADRLLVELTVNERILLRQRFGVDFETNASLEEISARFSATRRRIREIESQALIRLYRWENRKHRSPAAQRRLARRVAAAHDDILKALCDAPPVRPVLIGWHDQLIDGRRPASEIAEPPVPLASDHPNQDPQSPERILAAMLRRALWLHARGCKAVRDSSVEPAGRDNERARALHALRAIRLNAQSIRWMAEALLGHARRLRAEDDDTIPGTHNPAMDQDAPVLLDIPCGSVPSRARESLDIREGISVSALVSAESGMRVCDLRNRAARVDKSLATARHNLRLLVDSSMPMMAELAVSQGLRGIAFYDGIERGRKALWRLAERFCFTNDDDFAAASEKAVRAALAAPDSEID